MLKELPEDYDPDTQDDASLAIHLKSDHNLQTSESFDKNFRFTVVQISDPKSLAHNEYQWMSDLQTLKPFGLNVQKPYGIDEILLKLFRHIGRRFLILIFVIHIFNFRT